eukprot:1770986-Pleurochrysis_carterae.AAC.1
MTRGAACPPTPRAAAAAAPCSARAARCRRRRRASARPPRAPRRRLAPRKGAADRPSCRATQRRPKTPTGRDRRSP